MARIRTIKPEFWQDEDLSTCSPHARLLAIALLQLCDKNGAFRYIPMQIHAHAFPWETSVNIPALLGELERINYLQLYTVEGKQYGLIPGFVRHQRIQGKEAKSEGQHPLPKQEDTGRGNNGEYPDDSPGDTGKGKGKGNRKEEIGTGNNCESGDSRGDNRDYVWEKLLEVCDLSQSELTTSARGSCNKAVKALKEVSATPSDIEIRSKRYREIYPNATLTPAAMAKHWAQCRPETKKSPVADILEYAR